MADIVDRETRSRMMSGIQAKNTKPELQVRKYLHKRGLRYKLHAKELPGKPDLVLPKYGAVVFVHGCFWHQHAGYKYATTPSSRKEFWTNKLSENIGRDAYQIAALKGLGWRVFVVWECELRYGLTRLDLLYTEITEGNR